MIGSIIKEHPKLIRKGTALLTAATAIAALHLQVTDPVSKSLFIKQGESFQVSLLPVLSDEPEYMIPGETSISFDPFISNRGDYDIYAFIEVTLPDADFALDKVSPDWTIIYSDNTRKVFVYGSQTAAEPVKKRHKSNGEFLYESTTELNTVVTLAEDSDLEGGPYSIEAVGYAIEANSSSRNPNELWAIIEKRLASKEYASPSGIA